LRMGKFSIPKFAASRAQPSSIPNFKSGLPPASRIQYTRANADARYNSAYDRHPSSMFIQLSTVESGSLSRQQMSSHARAAIDLGRASADRTLSEILLKASAQDGAQKMVDATVPTADSELNAALASHNNAAEALRFQRTPRSSNKESINRNYNLPAVPGSKLFEETRKWMLKNDPDLHRQMTASKARFASAGVGTGSWVSDKELRKGFGGIKQQIADMVQAQEDKEKTTQLEDKISKVRNKAKQAGINSYFRKRRRV